MSVPGKLTVSAAAAAIIRGGAADKLRAASGETPLTLPDLLAVLYFLCREPDPALKGAAVRRLREIPENALCRYVEEESPHPRIVDLLAKAHCGNRAVAMAILRFPGILPETLAFLKERVAPAPPAPPPVSPPDAAYPAGGEEGPEDDTPVDEESEEFKSKYQQAQSMGVAEKIKMALTGDKEWRTILIRDSNKLVNGAVIKNPRITLPEVITIVKSNIQNDEIIRVITRNREWMKKYDVRKGLVLNHRTPLPLALRLVSLLTEKDVQALAKSRNISTVIATQARKVMMQKKRS